jgi:hypothetical protein
MKHQKTHADSEYLSEWNAATAEPNQVKMKRKTVVIKLQPKPNAPRHAALRPARARLQPN